MELVGEAPSLRFSGSQGCGLVTPGGATPGGARGPVGGMALGGVTVCVGSDCPLRVALLSISRVPFSPLHIYFPKSCAKMYNMFLLLTFIYHASHFCDPKIMLMLLISSIVGLTPRMHEVSPVHLAKPVVLPLLAL